MIAQHINTLHPKDQIVACLHHIYNVGLTTCSGGNISMIDDDNLLWITPSGTDKGTLQSSEVYCFKDDKIIHGKPSLEHPIHRLVLKTRKDFKVVIHAHP